MKKNLFKILLVLGALVLNTRLLSQTENSFVKKQQLGNQFASRSSAGLIEYNNNLYIYGGKVGSNMQDFAKYDLSTNRLTKLEQMPDPGTNVKGKTTFKVGNYMYHFDVYGTGVSRYNLATNTWDYDVADMPQVAFIPDSGFLIGTTVYLTTRMTGSNSLWSFNTADLTWTQKADYPDASGKRGTFAFTANGNGYYGGGRSSATDGCGGGYGNAACWHNSFYEYNPATDSWTKKSDFPLGIVGAVGVSVGNKGYVGLGTKAPLTFYGREVNSSLWYEYNPTTDIWTTKRNFMNSASASDFYTSISEASITAVGSDVYVFGGHINYYGSIHLSNDNLYKYNTITDSWTLVNDELGGNRTEATGVFINGKLYAGGGRDGEAVTDFHEYNPQADSWQQKANFPIQFSSVGATSIGDKGYFVGGYQAYGPSGGSLISNKLYEYDALSNIWSEKASYPGGSRRSLVVESYKGEVYAGFGFYGGGGFAQGFYKYNPKSNTWTKLNNPTFSNSDFNTSGFHASSFVLGDYLYIILHNYSSEQDSMQKYSFASNTWTPIPLAFNGLTVNQYVNMGFSFNGKGYLVFDESSNYMSMKKLMEFDPATNTLSFAAKIPFYASSQVVVEGTDGVYFAFGETNLGDREIAGLPNSNQLWKWTPNPAIATATGLYSESDNTASCGITLLEGQHSYITDDSGNLFLKLQGGNQSAPVCLEVNSINGKYRELTGDFGQGNTKAMFANKSFLQKSGQINNDNSVRIYFTAEEINSFITAFNSAYNESKTINDIKIMSHYDSTNPLNADHDPLNNLFFATNNPTQSLYKILSPTVGDYSNGKYFEIVADSSNSNLLHEVYIVLFSDKSLSDSNFEQNKIVLFPNPVDEKLIIEMDDFKEVKVTDLTGKLLLETTETTVNFSQFSEKVYLISISNNKGETFIKKVIKK